MQITKKSTKRLLKLLIFLLNIGLFGFIIYLASNCFSQIKNIDNIKLMSNQLVDAILPLTNLLSKSAGIIHYHKNSYDIYTKPSLFYTKHNKSYILDLILSNPSYNLIDCTGNFVDKAVYPLKISFIWQPMLKFENQYELICEKHNNFKNFNNVPKNIDKNIAKNTQKKVLLQHINQVKLQFLVKKYPEPEDDLEFFGIINAEDLQHMQERQITAVQIGMLVQGYNNHYKKEQYKSYHIFNQKIKFFDRFLRKVIYITIPADLS